MALALLQIVQSVLGPDYALYLSYFAIALSIAAVLVKLTPTKKDDEILAKVQELYGKVMEKVGDTQTKPAEAQDSDVKSY